MNIPAFPVPPARIPAILIVDDAPANLGMLRTMMTQQGYQTFVANSGERALSIARRVQPDLILLDVVMPGIDGFETCRKLKEHPATEHIPVIFMSAKSDTDDIVAGFDIGAADYIGKPLRMAEVCARVRAQLQMRSTSFAQKEQAERLHRIVNGMDEGLMIVEADGRIQYSNPACERYLGYGPNELAGRSLPDLLGPALAQGYLEYFAACAVDPVVVHTAGAREVLIRHSDGGLRAMDLTLSPMLADEPLFIGLLHDITHHKQSETALQHAAMVDQLTQIANRRRFDHFLDKEWQRALRSGQPLSLIVLDVDHFKLYNDTLGHAAGDLCLQKVAAALQSRALRTTDLAARYGGEEFVLLFAETAQDTALVLAESIRALVESLHLPHPGSPTSEWLTVSIGVASIVPTQLDRIEQFFVDADREMYAAKGAGRNRVGSIHNGNGRDALAPLVMI
ncbi:MAG: response regulator receiver modulated diguanylate cyclase [Massilia sp.]|nr:response regulator receiver modulated diguanylate cyclase [Massilia sp.]